MHANKVYVQRRGNVFRVPVDLGSGQPIPVSSVHDDPPGFPMTFTSEMELKQAFPGKELVYLTEKVVERPALTYDAEIEKQALAMIKNEKIASPPTPAPVKAVASQTAIELPVDMLSHKQKAEEFLKRLQTALQYASKKHEKKLQDQVAIIEELIREIF